MTQFRTAGRLSAIAAAAMMIAASATPAFAADPTSSNTTAREKRICVSEIVTGSRLPQKVCKTRAQWIKEDGYDPSTTSR